VINTIYSQLTPSACSAGDVLNNFSTSKSGEHVASASQSSNTLTWSISQLFKNDVKERYSSAVMRSYRRHCHFPSMLDSPDLEEHPRKRHRLIMLVLTGSCLIAVITSVIIVSLRGEDEPSSNWADKEGGAESLPSACCIEDDLGEMLEQNEPHEMQTSVFEQVIMPVNFNETIDSTPIRGNFSTDETGWAQSELNVSQNYEEQSVAQNDTALATNKDESISELPLCKLWKRVMKLLQLMKQQANRIRTQHQSILHLLITIRLVKSVNHVLFISTKSSTAIHVY
jgi:hypothetical protein